MRLVDLALALGRSVGWLSQVERDLSQPAVSDLQDIARCLDVPLLALLRSSGTGADDGYVVRRAAHRAIPSGLPGVVEERLSHDGADPFSVVRTIIAPESRLERAITRATTEVGFVVSGRISLWIAGARFDIGTGDSFRISGEPLAWLNPHAEPCEIIWVFAPPDNG